MQQKPGAPRPLAFEADQRVAFEYVNWRGERAQREAEAVSIRYGSTEWHPEAQWLLLGRDARSGQDREFALGDMVPAIGTELVFRGGLAHAALEHPTRGVALFDIARLRFGNVADGAAGTWLIVPPADRSSVERMSEWKEMSR